MHSKTDKTKDKNRALIESLRPHFVFNVMNILRYIIKKDPAKASEMVYDLSLYMRCRLGMLQESERTTFEEELNFVKAYLRLEQVALPNLKFVADADNGIYEAAYEINRGTLLESVETLVKEHVRPTKELRTIRITNCEDNGQLIIKIVIEETNVCVQL